MKVNEVITEAVLDPTGWGQTPNGTDIDYFGLRVQMRPSTFLKLALPLGQSETNPEVEKYMKSGGKIAYPMLEIKIPSEWEDGQFKNPAMVVSHEGRNRMTQWVKLHGDEPIQINILPRGGMRRRHITDQMIYELSKGMISQRGNFVSGPLFPTDSALEEVTINEMTSQDFKITNTPKLDKILAKCCELVLDKQREDSQYWGMVGACVLDMDNRAVFGVNHEMPDGTRSHAERVAIDNYTKKYGDLQPGSIIITTLSPCSDDMDERYGESCTELINNSDIHKVYCGYQDPTQIDSEAYLHKQFHCMESRNKKLVELCKRMADTFLDPDHETK